jgi:hypothetical protein
VSVKTNGEFWPASGLVVPAVNDGANAGGLQAPSIVIGESSATGSGDAHEVISTCVLYVPQLAGVASGAADPPWNATCNRENGSWGVLSNVATSWPLSGSRSTLPGSLR